MTRSYDEARRNSTWNIGRLAQILAAALLLLALIGFPPVSQAQETHPWTWTAPTGGGAVSAYQFAVKSGSGAWTTHADSVAVLTVPVLQAAGTVIQTRVRAFNHKLEPVLDANGQLIGSRRVRQYGPWSDYSDPSVVDIAAPGGCGRPVRQ